jgi:tetratricopeptide (TPR) repeat protein
VAVGYRAELGIAMASLNPKKGKAIAERALTELEASIKADTSASPDQLDTRLVKTVPLVRAARGDEAAVKRWLECDRAEDVARTFVALDAALALEATGNLEQAEKAYLLAKSPTTMEFWTLPVLAARLKLAQLYRSQGRLEAAVKLDGVFDQLWSNADPGFRKALLDLR